MKVLAILSLALANQVGSPLVITVGDQVPVINVEKTCKGHEPRSSSIGRELHARRECRATAACCCLVDVFRFHSRSVHAGSDFDRHRQLCRLVDLYADDRSGETNTNNGPQGREQKSKQKLARYVAWEFSLSAALFLQTGFTEGPPGDRDACSGPIWLIAIPFASRRPHST
jgi:hypothetical protein